MAKRRIGTPWEEAAEEFSDEPLEQRMVRVALAALEPPDEDTAEEAAALSGPGTLGAFVKHFWKILEPENDIVWGWHLDVICAHLEAVTAGEMRNLIINMPPRHAKSLIVCVFWFCWTWASRPTTRWLFSSYSGSLSARDSGKCLDVILSDEYQRLFGGVFRLRPGQRAMSKFTNNKAGQRISTSVMGKGMGEGGDFVVVDDPHKPTEVHSDVLRERVNSWWAGTMTGRGNNPRTARRVVVMQRLHERDLSGYLLASDLGYEHLCLPAEYEPKRYFIPTPEQPKPATRIRDMIVPTTLQRKTPSLMDPRRKDGELLWPERFGPKELGELKRGMATGAAGQLGQRPSPEAGEFYTRQTFRYAVEEVVVPEDGGKGVPCYTLLPSGREKPVHIPKSVCRHFATADTAIRKEITSSATAVTIFASCPVLFGDQVVARYLLIVESFSVRLTVPEQYPFLRSIVQRYPELLFLGVEPKASGVGLIQQSVVDGHPFMTLPVQGDKIQRAAASAQLYSDGLIFHRQGMAGMTDLEDELLTFPNGASDDIVDTVAYGARLFNTERVLTAYNESSFPSEPADDEERPGGDVYKVGGVEVVFPDEPEWWDD